MSGPFGGAWIKLGQATRHFLDLGECLLRWQDQEPDPVVTELKIEGGHYTFRARIDEQVPHIELALRIGDCLHNARSALDHVAWALAEDPVYGVPLAAHVPPESDTGTQFPVFADSTKYSNHAPRSLRRIGTRAKTLIELAQPYHRPPASSDPLLLLHALDVADKHKLLLLTASTAEGSTVDVRPIGPIPAQSITKDILTGPFEDRAIIATVTVFPPEAEVEVTGGFFHRIAFRGGAAHGLDVERTVRDCIHAARITITDLENALYP